MFIVQEKYVFLFSVIQLASVTNALRRQ